MFILSKYTAIFPISLSIAFLMTACNESKVNQCQRLMEVVNKGTELIDKNKGQQVITSIQLSKDLQAVSKEIEEQNFKDPKLQEFQNRFVKVFETVSKSIAQAGQALGSAKVAKNSSEGRVKIQKARGDIDTALTAAANTAKQLDSTASDLNKYCNQPE
jgi:vacuolar-type H+-ATPase subunit I/STV1